MTDSSGGGGGALDRRRRRRRRTDGRTAGTGTTDALLFALALTVAAVAFGAVALVLHSRLDGGGGKGGSGVVGASSGASSAAAVAAGAGLIRADGVNEPLTDPNHSNQRRRHSIASGPGPGPGSSSPCQTVYFWGGHKSGSTSLAALLKHRPGPDGAFAEHDPMGQFVQSPKEVCWALAPLRETTMAKWRTISRSCDADAGGAGGGPPLLGDDDGALIGRRDDGGGGAFSDDAEKGRRGSGVGTGSNGRRRFALDGCPFYHTAEHAIRILRQDPTAKFVMLVRDPVDRLVSHLNADWRRAVNRNEQAVRRAADGGEGGGGGEDNNFDAEVMRIVARGKLIASAEAAGNDGNDGNGRDRNRGDSDGGGRRHRGGETRARPQRRSERVPPERRARLGRILDRAAAAAAGGRERRRRPEPVRGRGGRGEGRQRGIREGMLTARRNGGGADVGGAVGRDRDHWSLSTYGTNLRTLLRVLRDFDISDDPTFSRVLVVQTTALSHDPQGVLDAVMDHIGGERKVAVGGGGGGGGGSSGGVGGSSTSIVRQNDGEALGGYRDVTEGVRDEAREAFRSDVELLEGLVGRRFAWSSWTDADPAAGGGAERPLGIKEDDGKWTAVVPADRG